MLRLRAPDGKVFEIDTPYRFVEICDMDGKVARALYMDDMGLLHDVSADSSEAARYRKIFKVEFVAMRPLP